jgi:hypothetical protein
VSEIRSLAISCHNKHGDSELSAQVLALCRLFRFTGTELDSRLEEDSRVIGEIVAENREHSFSAWVHEDQAVYITHKGISFAGDEVGVADIETVRWGIYVRTVNGMETDHSFTLVVRGGGRSVTVQLDKRGLIGCVKRALRKKDEVIPIDQLPSAHQEAYFRRMIDGVLHYLVPPLITKLVERLVNGESVQIGPCNVSRSGLAFCAGLVFSKDYLVSWADVDTQMESGKIRVFSRSNRKAQCEMSLRDTDNAVILPILCAAMCEHATPGQQQSQPMTARDPTVGDEPVSHVNVSMQEPGSADGRQCSGASTMPSSGAPMGTGGQHRRSSTKAVVALVIVVTVIVLFGIASLKPVGQASRGGSYPPQRAMEPPAYRSPSSSGTSSTESRTSYRVPSYVSAELERDSQAIDRERLKANQLGSQLESLAREIEQDRLSLDRTSRSAVGEFNGKVTLYNDLRETVRAQERVVNQMVTDYNAKLRKYGR